MRSHIDLSRSDRSVFIACQVTTDEPLPAAAFVAIQALAESVERAMTALVILLGDEPTGEGE